MIFQCSVSAASIDQCIWPQLYSSLDAHARNHGFKLPTGSVSNVPPHTTPSASSSSTTPHVSEESSAGHLHTSPWVPMQRVKKGSGNARYLELLANHDLVEPDMTYGWLTTSRYPKYIKHPTKPGPLLVFGMFLPMLMSSA